MPSEIRIPRLGWNMEEGVFLGWLRRDGEAVRVGEPLFTLEGEKAAQEVEVVEDGVLWIDPDGPKPGVVVPVGAVIGALLRPGENPPAAAPAVAEAAVASPAPAATARKRPRSSPLARRIARELNIDWTTLHGSGRNGRIRKADVLAEARVAPRAEASRVGAAARSIPIGPRRRTIASRLVESRAATAPVTMTTTVDATNLVNLRGQFRAADADRGLVPSYTDFVVTLTALALRDHPLLNARWEGDRIDLAAEAHIGIAVDTEAGLLVPVIRGADGLGLRQIAERSRDLIGRARAGTLAAAEMQGGTFTITNLGALGIEAFTPIINLPECAILGLGRIAREPALVGDRVEARERLTLSLTFDHRIVDGAPAARFLQDLGRRIENPGPWLLS
jgi:pyruvate dehydrogenase E2 component (dihydrolipoamide acetyltransferase)